MIHGLHSALASHWCVVKKKKKNKYLKRIWICYFTARNNRAGDVYRGGPITWCFCTRANLLSNFLSLSYHIFFSPFRIGIHARAYVNVVVTRRYLISARHRTILQINDQQRYNNAPSRIIFLFQMRFCSLASFSYVCNLLILSQFIFLAYTRAIL